MKTPIVAVLAVFSVLPIFSADAQQITKASADAFKKQLTVQISDGVTAVVDKATQTIYLANRNGQTAEISFSDAVAAAEPNPSKRAAMLNQFQSSLSDPAHIMTLMAPRVATDTTYWPREGGGGGGPTHPTNLLPKRGGEGNSVELSAVGSLGSPCDLGPCSPNRFDRYNPNPTYMYDANGAGWGVNQGGGSLSYQQYLIDDKSQFENARKDACQEKWTTATETSSVGAATVAACIGFETGIGALGCAGGIVAYGIGLYWTDKAADKCAATYPGPGNW